jgi:hypothetical protein
LRNPLFDSPARPGRTDGRVPGDNAMVVVLPFALGIALFLFLATAMPDTAEGRRFRYLFLALALMLGGFLLYIILDALI